MLSLPLPVKIFWRIDPTDLRKSFDGLAAIVREELGHDPFSGHLFIFASKRRNRVKLLYFEKGGFAIWYKRLEEGTFAMPIIAGDGKSALLSAEDFALLLSGVEPSSVKRRKRYERISA